MSKRIIYKMSDNSFFIISENLNYNYVFSSQIKRNIVYYICLKNIKKMVKIWILKNI